MCVYVFVCVSVTVCECVSVFVHMDDGAIVFCR